MEFALQAITENGMRLVALAEEHAAGFATRAAEYDREGSFPVENIEDMQRSAVMSACIPEEFGGLGVESVHDYVVGMSRLGRGDGSTALAATMHISQAWMLVRYWRETTAAGDEVHSTLLESHLRQVGSGKVLMSSVVAEPGTDILHPHVKAIRTEGGWLLNGRKMFGTGTPVAQLLEVTCQVQGSDGGRRFAVAHVPRSSSGVDIKNNWDALGMRSSGSHDVEFSDCFLPESAVTELGPWGTWTEPYLAGNVVITLGLVGVFLGIAEAARELVVDLVKSRRKGSSGRLLAERPAIQHTVAEIEIDLAASRAMLARTATETETFFRNHTSGATPLEEFHQLMKDFQCTKWFVTRRAIEIVDRALTASGGSGYLSKSPLSRLYRDVRAGPFMQPFSPNEAFEYIGKVTLGLPPTVAD